MNGRDLALGAVGVVALAGMAAARTGKTDGSRSVGTPYVVRGRGECLVVEMPSPPRKTTVTVLAHGGNRFTVDPDDLLRPATAEDFRRRRAQAAPRGVACDDPECWCVSFEGRGSRALTSLTATPSASKTALPWKRLVGAARGGPSLEAYARGLARIPLDITVEVVGSEREKAAWLKNTRRPGKGKLRLCVHARTDASSSYYEQNTVERIETGRKQAPSSEFALFSPFAIAHRMFDMPQDAAQPMSTALNGIELGDSDDGESAMDIDVLREWSYEDCEDAGVAAQQDEDGEYARDEAIDACLESMAERWERVKDAFERATRDDMFPEYTPYLGEGYDDWNKSNIQRDRNHEDPGQRPSPAILAALPHMEKSEELQAFVGRVLTSLACPTAAGRLLRLLDTSQALADCYATWVVSGRDPLVRLSKTDITKFSPDAQVKRWLATGPGKRATPVEIARYRSTLEQVAVPAIALLKKARPKAIDEFVRAVDAMHRHRAPLIEAFNDMLAMQRVLAI